MFDLINHILKKSIQPNHEQNQQHCTIEMQNFQHNIDEPDQITWIGHERRIWKHQYP